MEFADLFSFLFPQFPLTPIFTARNLTALGDLQHSICDIS